MGISAYFSKNLKLRTDRLLLRKIRTSDASDMYEYSCRPETSEYLLWDVHPYYSYTLEVAKYLQKEYSEGKCMDFAIEYKENGKMIGTVGFTSFDEKNSVAEAGYVISPDYWGKGIATEALTALLNFAFCELGVNRVEAKYIIENKPSLKVMEKCGLKPEGVLRQRMLIKGKYRDIGICSILKSEYFTVKRDNIYAENEHKGVLARLFHKN